MRIGELVAIELRNVRPFSALIALAIVLYVGLRAPVDRVLAALAADLALLVGGGIALTFVLAWAFAYLFGGFSAVVKRENDVYDRYFALPVTPWRVFGAELLGVAVPGFLATVGCLALVAARVPAVPLWFPVAMAPVGLVSVVGTAALVFAVTLYFDNPRAPTVAYFAGVGLVAAGLPHLAELPVGSTALAALAAAVPACVCVLSLAALRRLSARHLHA